MGSMPLGPGLPSPAMLLFNCPIRGIMPIINRPLIGLNNNEDHFEVLMMRGTKYDKNHDTFRIYPPVPLGSTVVVQCEDGDCGPMEK